MPGAILLYAQYVVLVMVGGVECRHVVFAGFQHYEYLVVACKLAEECASFLVVESQYVGVKPHFAASKR